jgi:hypothetical protein
MSGYLLLLKHSHRSNGAITAKKVQEQYEISASKIRNWENSGKIEAKKTPGGKRLYKADYIDKLLGTKESSRAKSKSAMQGSVFSTRKQTSNAKSKTLGKRTPSMRLSQKSQAATTGPGRSLMPL